jgi:hypothetical protein
MTSIVPEHLVEIGSFEGIGYQPIFDYGEWRVAILRFIDELLPENITSVQCHLETDEVFVLLAGRCILFFVDGENEAAQLYAVEMEPRKQYNVKKGQWHTHVLSRDATVLIVENRDTSTANSLDRELSIAHRQSLIEIGGDLV